MQSEIKRLKLNANNIKSTLISGNKTLKKLRANERSFINKQRVSAKRIQKESFVEGSIPGSGVVGGAARRIAAPAMSLFDKLKNFAGTVLLGLLVNNLPPLIEKIKKFLKDNMWLFKTIGEVFKFTGNLFMVLVDLYNMFRPEKRAQLEAEKKQLNEQFDALFGAVDGMDGDAKAADGAVNDYVGDAIKEELRQKTPQQVKSDVVTAIKDQGIKRPEFVKSVNQYNAARKLNEVTKAPIVIPGVGSYEKVKTGGFFGMGASIKPVAKDTYGYEITPEEFEKRYQYVRSNWTSMKEQLTNEGVEGYSQGGTVKPASPDGGSFPGESASLKKAVSSTQTFSLFENNENSRSGIIQIQEHTNKGLKDAIEKLKDLTATKIGDFLPQSSEHKLPSPEHKGPVTPHAPGQADPELGRIVGYVGSTGLSTGNHIHIETGDGYAPHDDAGKPIPQSVLDNIIVDGRPLHAYNMTSGPVMRQHPVTGEMRQHLGYDYPIRGGAPIQLKGGLKYVNFHDAGSGGFGKSIMIQDDQGNNYIIGHLSKGPDPATLQPSGPSGGPGSKSYGKGGATYVMPKKPSRSKVDNLTQFFDGEGMTDVLIINSTQPIIVPGPTRYIRR